MITDEFIENLQHLWHETKGTKAEECPDEELVIGYAFSELDAKNTQLIHKHILQCRHCLELVLDVREAYAEAQEQKETVILPVIENLKKTLSEKYTAKIQNGIDTFKAAIEAVKEYLSFQYPVLSFAPTRGEKEHSKEVYIIGQEQPHYPLNPPSEAEYYTLIMARNNKEDIVILNDNETVEHNTFSPGFTEEDIGINQLYLIFTIAPLDVRPDEVEIEPDRFIEIIDDVKKKQGQVVSFDIDVKENA